jgi:peptide/nickel transport system substrate-binding protein
MRYKGVSSEHRRDDGMGGKRPNGGRDLLSRKIGTKGLAVLAILALLVAACSSKPKTGGGGTAQTGGTLRIQVKTFRWTDAFDPSGEYLGYAWGLYSNMLVRTLLGYRHVAGDAGNQTIPDLADGQPTVSADGLNYTFKIKSGIKFGPPINREVVAKDFVYSFERIAKKSVAAQYAGYYKGVIKGLNEYADGKASTISGITTPDPHTISFALTKPTGDFNYRMAMPATGPIPQEVGKCFEKAGEYGKYIISTAGYMLEGVDKIDPTSCATLKAKAPTGFDPSASGHLTLVRNPNYDASTDTKEARENFVDGLTMNANANVDDIFNKILADQVDAEKANEPPNIIQRASTDLKNQVHAFGGDRNWYFSMNLLEKPFDDVHVRRAMNYAMDRQALLRLSGGPITGSIAQADFPQSLLMGRLADYKPWGPDTGDLTKAQAEMKLSKYDTNKDGKCNESSACKGVEGLTEDAPPFSDYVPTVKDAASKLGITMNIKVVADSYPTAQDVSKRVPFFMGGGWGKDYADLYTFAYPLFDSATIVPTGNSDYPLVGLTAQQAKDFKAGPYPAGGVANVDADIAACGLKSGNARLDCWAALDKKLTFDIAAWIPYRDATNIDTTATTVTKYVFDQFSGEMAFSHIAIDASKQKNA